MSKFSCLDVAGTHEEFAELIGVTRQAVGKLVQRGVLPRGGTLAEWLLYWARHFREQAAGRGGAAGTQEELAQARIRESMAKAQKAEVETGERLRELVHVRDLEPALRDWASRGKQSIESASERIVDGIESEFSIALEDHHVRDHLHAVLRDIGGYPSQHSVSADEHRERVPAARTGTDG